MSSAQKKAPLRHRMLVWFFSALFGVLVFWLIGFVINDIRDITPPDHNAMIQASVPQELFEQSDRISEKRSDLELDLKEVEQSKSLLKVGIESSQQTIDQVLEIQRLALEKESELPPDAVAAMSENIQLFLANQKRYQELNNQATDLNTQLDNLKREALANSEAIEQASAPVNEKYYEALERQQLMIAAMQLSVLVPCLLLVAGFYVWKSSTVYAPIIYASGVAIAVRAMMILHEHFSAYSKYILIIVLLGIVLWILIRLLRNITNPQRDWLLRQYREAYESFFCPICDYPIRRGPLKFMSWTRRSLRKKGISSTPTQAGDEDAAYACPACGTQLYEECESCKSTRHSLLPHCNHCGDEKPLVAGDST